MALDVAHLVLDGGREDVGVELLTIAPCMFPCSLIKRMYGISKTKGWTDDNVCLLELTRTSILESIFVKMTRDCKRLMEF